MDFNSFNDDIVKMPHVLVEDIDLFVSELNILFSTNRGSILGRRTFGHSIEHLLWQTSYNAEYIQADIEMQIEANCLMHELFDYEVDFSIQKGISQDIGQLNIIIKNKGESNVLANPGWVFK